MEKSKDRIHKEMNDLRSKFRRFCKDYENLQEQNRIQELAIEEGSLMLSEFQQLKWEFDQMKERLNISETQNFDKDVKISELKTLLDRLTKEKDVKLNELLTENDKLHQEKSALLLELKEIKFQQKRVALVPPMSMPSPKKPKIEVSRGKNTTPRALDNNNEIESLNNDQRKSKKVQFNLNQDENETENKIIKNNENPSVHTESIETGIRIGPCHSMIGIPSLESMMAMGRSPVNSISNNLRNVRSLKSILKKKEDTFDNNQNEEKNDDVACKGDSPKQLPFLWSVNSDSDYLGSYTRI